MYKIINTTFETTFEINIYWMTLNIKSNCKLPSPKSEFLLNQNQNPNYKFIFLMLGKILYIYIYCLFLIFAPEIGILYSLHERICNLKYVFKIMSLFLLLIIESIFNKHVLNKYVTTKVLTTVFINHS